MALENLYRLFFLLMGDRINGYSFIMIITEAVNIDDAIIAAFTAAWLVGYTLSISIDQHELKCASYLLLIWRRLA